MKKRIFASALAVLMVLSLCACGGNAASSAATSAGSAAPEETKAAQEATSPAEAASAGEASTNEAVTEYESIEYPIEGDQLHHDFRQAHERGRGTGEKDYSSTIESKHKMYLQYWCPVLEVLLYVRISNYKIKHAAAVPQQFCLHISIYFFAVILPDSGHRQPA